MLIERARLGGYREYAPPDDLRHIVAALWSYSRPCGAPSVPGKGHRLLPDADLSIALESRRDRRGVLLDARLVLIGPIATPRFFAPEAGLHIGAVRVHPEWCRDLFGAETGELVDTVREYRLPRLLDHLTTSTTLLADLLNAVCALADGRVVSREARLANEALRRVRASTHATLHLERIARALLLSERHLRRVVRHVAWFSPKHLQRIARFDRAIATADREHQPDWARIAGDSGYYDQPHMIGEFQALAGCTPAELARERSLQKPLSEISNPS